MPTVEVTGTNERAIKPDAITVDVRYRVRTTDWKEIDRIDAIVERDFSHALDGTGIEEKCVRLEDYALQSACQSVEGEYDCFECIRHYRITLPVDKSRDAQPVDVTPVVKLLRNIPAGTPPEAVEVRYVRKDCRQDIGYMEANALRYARFQADYLADAMDHHLGEHVAVKSDPPPADVSKCVYRMRRVEDLHLMRPELLTLPDGTFPLRCSVEAVFGTYKR